MFLSQTIDAQSNEKVSLKKAILEIAKTQKVSVIFNPSNIPDQLVDLPSPSLSLNDQIKVILKNTSLEFEYKNNEIFLYKKRQIYGYIEDAETGQRLISATVLIDFDNYDITNNFGHFSISTIKDSVTIETSYLGYATLQKTVLSKNMNKPIIIALKPDNNLEAVIISDAFISEDEKNYIELDKGTDILLYQNQATSVVGGEPDIFQAFQRQTGVNTGADGVGGIHVRGGKNDQNLIALDGVKLYNSAHAFGVYSLVNNSIIDQARLTKSGAEGSISGRLSSVMDIRTKDPSLKKFHANAQVSTLASQLGISTPIVKDKLGIMITGRRTHIDGVVKSLTKQDKMNFDQEGESNYSFYDFNLKMYGKLSNRDRLYFTFYQTKDQYNDFTFIDEFNDFTSTIDQRLDYNWSNQVAAIRYNTILSNSAFANFQVSRYKYNYQNLQEYNEADTYYYYFDRIYQDFTSGITSYEFKADFENTFANSTFKFGVNASLKNYQVGNLAFEDLLYIDFYYPIPPLELDNFQYGEYDAKEMNIYFTNKFKVNKKLLLSSGIYLNLYQSQDLFLEDENAFYKNVFGYVKSQYKIGRKLTIGASLGTFLQTEHMLTTGDSGYPSDIWIASTVATPPERSHQAEIFLNTKLKNHSLSLSAYYKKQNGIVFYDTIPSLPSVTILDSEEWEFQTILGSASGFGVELEYNFRIEEKLNFRTAYTYNKTDYSFDFINDGEPFPFDYSIPHTLALGTNIQLSTKTHLSLDWIYHTGKPFTLYETDFLYTPLERATDDTSINRIGGFNAQRLNNSHKLSVAITHSWNWGNVKSEASIGVQNVYNHKNQLYQYELAGFGREQQSGFPRLPMFRWQVSL